MPHEVYRFDEQALRESGVTDLSRYSVTPGAPLQPDFFV